MIVILFLHFSLVLGVTELLVDCVWVDDDLQCLAQEGFECKKPVSQIAEISVPTRFVSKPGRYKCIAGLGHGNINHCHVGKSHQQTQQKNKQEFIESEHGNSPNDEDKSSSSILGVAVGSTLGIIAVSATISTVFLVIKIRKKKSQPQENLNI